MDDLKFKLNDQVQLHGTDTKGDVIGVAQYTHEKPQFFVRYTDTQGDLQKRWFNTEDLSAS